MSKNTSNSFTGRTKSEWLEIIKSDLKGKDIVDLQADWLQALELSPFQHAVDRPAKTVQLSRAFRRPQLVQAFPGGETADTELLEALNQGVSAPYFPEAPSWDSFWAYHKEVQWDMLFPIFSPPLPDAPEAPEHPEQYTNRFYLAGSPAQNLSYRQKSGRFCFSIPELEASDLPAALAQWLVEIVQQVDKLDHDQTRLLFRHSLHKKQLGRNFFLELTALRAMRLLAMQLQADYALSPPVPIVIWADLGPQLGLDSLQESLIAYTTAGFAAVTGGADFIHIQAHSEEEEKLSQRLSRNIYHLFDMESHLFHVTDPAGGSYAIEKLSHQLAKAAWTTFSKSIQSA